MCTSAFKSRERIGLHILGQMTILSCRANNMRFTVFESISCIFCGSNSSITILICMYNNVSVPTSYVAGRNCHLPLRLERGILEFHYKTVQRI